MRSSDWLKTGAAGVLGAFGCGGDIASQSPKDKGDIVQSVSTPLNVPQFSDLERKVSLFSPEGGNKEGLLEQADYGKRFHSSVSLFLGNYTLGVSSGWFGYDFEKGRKVRLWEVALLRDKARAIRYNGGDNDADTLKRCDAAEELYGIMNKAEKEGHLDEAGKIIGYLDRASSITTSAFWHFKISYGSNFNNDTPKDIVGWYTNHAAEIRGVAKGVRREFGSLSTEVRDELTMWIGRYGHDALQGMTAETYWFRDNAVDRITRTRVLPDIPTTPTFRRDAFYRRFGEDLLRGYGLMTES